MKSHNSQIWSVSSITSYIKNLIESDLSLYNLWIKGEISDYKRAYSGHCYFKIKDKNAVLSCVMFKSKASRLNFEIENGIKILVRGNITIYEKGGNYQLLVEEIKPDGLGEFFLNFIQLKEKLKSKGYFNPERKKSIPLIPKGIGIATSLKGAGLQDMIQTIKRRFPPINIYISPTIVQGKQAPASIANSIKILDKCKYIDVIILGRGGGSFEDLNCFNDEKVANAIFYSKKPIISGIGHETDYTISDMTADFRAETPTAAAIASVPNLIDLKELLNQIKKRLSRGLNEILKNRKSRLKSLAPQTKFRLIDRLIKNKKQNLDYLIEKYSYLIQKKIDKTKLNLKHLMEKINTLNPKGILLRGYAIIREPKSHKIITSIKSLDKDKTIEIIVKDGSKEAIVI